MHEVSFKLETLTPLFLAGADQNEPELRAPSFRGVLRYWLRALLGGCLAHNGSPVLADVVSQEAEVFGTTDRGSSVLLRLQSNQMTQPEPFRRERRDVVTGQDYLFWSMAMQGQRRCYPPGGTFTVTLSMHNRPMPADVAQRVQEVAHRKAIFDQAVASFWLLTYLGGIGSRSRRGGGSLGLVETSGWEEEPRFQTSTTPEGFHDFLSAGLSAARRLCTRHPPAALRYADFDVLAPELCRIWILQDATPWTTAKQALEAIGSRLMAFRAEKEPDHAGVARWLTGSQIPTVERAIFGLPIQFRYSSGLSGFVQGAEHDRRASPLLLRVAKLGGASPRYVGVAVLFKSQFLRGGEHLKSKNRATNRPIYTGSPTEQGPGYGLIEQWVQREFPQALEVTGW